MKQLKYLLLLLVAIISQGAWGQVTPGQELVLGENRISIPSFSSAYSYSTDKSAYNLYKFIAPSTGTFKISSVSAMLDKAFAMFDADGNYVDGSIATIGNGYDCPVELTGGKTYYLGMRATAAYKAQTAYYNVEFTCTNHANTVLVPGTVTCTQAGTIDYLHCNDCHGNYSTDEEHYRLNDWNLNQDALGHNIENGVCTRCGADYGLAIGEKTLHFTGGNYAKTAFQFTATETGTVKLSIVTDADIQSAYFTSWDNYINPPAWAPHKAAPAGDVTNPYVVTGFVEAGQTYAVVFMTNAEEETAATINLDYYSILVSGENVDLATALANHPNAKGLSFDSWSHINACTVNRDITLVLGNTYLNGQLKIDNGAKVVLDGSNGNIDFTDDDMDKFAIEVLNGDVTYYGDGFNLFSGGFGGGVLVKKGSFTINHGLIRANEAIVARKTLGSTDDVAINVINGAQVWGSKVAIYMDVNGHLTIDNPGTNQGIQGDTQSIVAKAGTIDLSNIERYGIRNNGPTGAVENRPEPVMHGKVPYLYGVPAVAMQIGTAEEDFTGTTVLRMRNVCLPESANGDVDYQLVLITGSAKHPTRYQMANVQGKGQIVVENADYVELVEPVVVHDGNNTNVNFVSGTAQETVLKYTATESKILEVAVATDATVENCKIIPWAEWDGEPEDDNNSDVQNARRKASRIAGENNIIASKKVIAGNSYAIVFTTTTNVDASVTVTLDYTDVVYPEVFFGENDIVIEGVEGDADGDYNHYNLYKFVAPASGQAHFYTQGYSDTFGMLFSSKFESLRGDDDSGDGNNFKIDYELTEGETYYIGVRQYSGYPVENYSLVIEIDGYTPPLKEGNNKLTFKEDASNFLYGEFYYSYVPQESGYVTISCDDAYYMRVENNDSDIAGTEVGETTFSFIASANEDYIVYVAPNGGVKTAELTVVLEPINVVTTLSLGNNWVEIGADENNYEDGEWWDEQSTEAYTLFPFTPNKSGVLTVESIGNQDTMGAIFDSEGNFLKSGDDEGEDYNFKFYAVVEGEKNYYIGVRELGGEAIPLYLVNVSIKDLPQINKTLELYSEEEGEIAFEEALNNYWGEDSWEDIFSANGVTYKRTTTTSKWGTVVLPYKLQSNEKVAYYELTAADIPGGNLEFTKVDVVKPNTPTVYRILDGNQYDASIDGEVLIEKPQYFGYLWVATKADDWSMEGWYYDTTINTQDYRSEVLYISGDKFWHATGSLHMKPYRAYFYTFNWPSEAANAMHISFKDDNGVTTTIDSIIEENGEFTDVEAIYDLNGRQRNTIQRGVNIIRTADGKTRKFIKK